MVQHASANDEVEGAPELRDALDRELMQFEIVQIVLSLKIARVAKARLADVDRRDPALGFAKRISRRLRRAAAGDEDFQVSARAPRRPDQMKLARGGARISVEIPMRRDW